MGWPAMNNQQMRVIVDEQYGCPSEDPEGGCHCGIDCNRDSEGECPLDGFEPGARFFKTDDPAIKGVVAERLDDDDFAVRFDGEAEDTVLSDKEMLEYE